MSSEQDYLGFTFTGEADVQSATKEFVLLPQGRYLATIKDVALGNTSKNNIPKIIVYFELEDGIVVKKDYIIPDKTATTGDFKYDTFKNLFTRVLFSGITRSEFKNMTEKTVNEACTKVVGLNGISKHFIGKKVDIEITQEPFISKKKETNEITGLTSYEVNYTKLPFNISTAPTQIKNLFKGTEHLYVNLPSIMFSNSVAPMSIGFANDFVEGRKSNSLAYEWYQKLSSQVFSESEEY